MVFEAADSTLSTFTSTDGDNLAVQEWPLPEGLAVRGVVLIVHGLGEHAGRYEHVARRLNSWGFTVRSYDHYGHGESGGPRGGLPTPERLVDDLADLIDSTRVRMAEDMPLVLFGHSLGGLVAASLVAQRKRKIDGLVLSSPALDAGLSRWQRFLVSVLPRIAPNLTVSNGLNPNFLSHDHDVVSAYRSDPLVHDRVSARLGRFIANAGPAGIAQAPRWSVPTLLLYAGRDRLVDPAGSRSFARSAPQGLVSSRCFEAHFHEIFNELDNEPVFRRLQQWLDERF